MEERLFMKISHIREFLLLVSNRNFSKTAEQLYMAQSALSRHISPIKKDAEDTFRTTAGCRFRISEHFSQDSINANTL